MLGKVTDASPDTFEPNALGTTKKSLTIRWEEDEGTNDRVIQAVGCYAVELYGRGQIGSPLYLDVDFAFSKIEDDGDSRPILTTAPAAPGGVSTAYDGYPIVVYDVGGGSEATLTDIIMAEFRIKQNWKFAKATDHLSQTIYLYTFEPVSLVLTAYMESDSKWDDFIDQATKDYSVQFKKPDGTNYVKLIFDNCKWETITRSTKVFKGLVKSSLMLKAEKATGTFTFEGENWGTHFKTAA
jgi:hypothetical protein